MTRYRFTAPLLSFIIVVACLGTHRLDAQDAVQPNAQNGEPPTDKDKKPEPPPLPSDPRLLTLHREFVKKAEKLAAEYEHSKQPDKALVVYEEILKLVPAYPRARQALDRLHERELTADRRVFDVLANKSWQDTGIKAIPGKPIRITASGAWTFNMSHKLGPEGMEIPPALKNFKLGSLIGVINAEQDDPKKIKPFYIGQSMELTPQQSGPLLVRMHDSDPSDNSGKITLEITGRFERE